jgi:hypothetical protein
MILETDIAEHQGIAWRLETAEPAPHNPLINPAYPWDSGAFFAHGTVLRDPIDGQLEGMEHLEQGGSWRFRSQPPSNLRSLR